MSHTDLIGALWFANISACIITYYQATGLKQLNAWLYGAIISTLVCILLTLILLAS